MDIDAIKAMMKKKRAKQRKAFKKHLADVSQFNAAFESSNNNKNKLFSATNGKFFRKSPKFRILTPTLPEKKIAKSLLKTIRTTMQA